MLDLSTIHVTQHSNGHTKTDWSVQLNETNEEIFVLPKTLNEKQVFAIMDFAKKYELIAFNKGINFQKGKENSILKEKIDTQNMVIEQLKKENERMSNIVDVLTKG